MKHGPLRVTRRTGDVPSSCGRRLAWTAILAALASAGLAAQASAQEPPAQPAASPDQAASTGVTSSVGEVVVTARRRAESLEHVPVAVDVVNGAVAQAHNLNDIADISTIVPTVDFRTGASNKDRTIFVRGIGTISTSPGVEPSVSTVIDGVVMSRPGMATLDLVDIDHIEVLEGPQGTLFGKNASAGVINIVTANPTDTPHAFVGAGIFEGAEYRANVGVSGPIIGDKLEGLIEAFTGQYRGNVENVYDGVDKMLDGYRHTGVRAKFIARPTDNLKLTFGADFTDSSDTTPTGVFSLPGVIAYPSGVYTPNATLAGLLAASGVTPGPDNTTVANNTDSSVHDKNGGVNLQADWTVFNDYTITSITAYRRWNNTQYQDYDELPTPVPGLAQGIDTGLLDFNQTSEEIRLTSPKGHLIDYVLGLYYLHAVDTETYSRAVTTVAAAGAMPVDNFGVANYGTTEDNFALYGEGDLNLTRKLRLIAGYREVFDWLSYYDTRVSTAATTGLAASFVNPPSTDRISGYADRFGIQYDITPSVTSYFTYSRGYKGPAYNVFFNMAAVNDAPLAPETSNDFEVGVKSVLFDDHVRANFEGFIEDFNNFQANFTQSINGGLVTNLINAGSVSTRGVEADVTAKPIDVVTLTLDALYDDAKVDDFNCPIGAPTSCNINGQPLPFAPRYKLHAGGEYRFLRTAVWDLQLESDYNYQSKTQYQLTEQASTIQPGYGIWNADVALLGRDNGWQVRFLVKNILNQHYSPYLAPSAVGGGTVRFVPRDDDRYVGATLRKDF